MMFESMDVFWAAFGGGAAGSLVTLVAVLASEWLKWRLSEPKVAVSIALGHIRGGIVYRLNDSPPEKVLFSIENVRTRPVTIIGFGVIYKRRNRNRAVFFPEGPVDLPQEITAGKSLNLWINTETYLESLIEDSLSVEDIKYAYVDTADSREFRTKIKRETANKLSLLLQQYTIFLQSNDKE